MGYFAKAYRKNSHIISNTVSVEINIGASLIIKNLSTFFGLLTNQFSYLRVEAISSFYYMDKERAQALKSLFQSQEESKENTQ